MIKRKKEQLELNAMLAESTAKFAVLQASESRSGSKASHTVLSHLIKEVEKAPSTIRNPMAEEFEFAVGSKMVNQVPTVDPPLASSVLHQIFFSSLPVPSTY
ncbi:hypothetical protein QQF64_018441 [Cirrhinus molitorella]|uniref:Uncharacterized protein n=1 Tax=Cirrhinus molitorella TaxID=172907 RepID=A0ABR3LE53_9TELE